jgi:dienelactone hydrolase
MTATTTTDQRDPSKVYGINMKSEFAIGADKVGTVWAIAATRARRRKHEQRAHCRWWRRPEASSRAATRTAASGPTTKTGRCCETISTRPRRLSVTYSAGGKQHRIITGPAWLQSDRQRHRIMATNAPNISCCAALSKKGDRYGDIHEKDSPASGVLASSCAAGGVAGGGRRSIGKPARRKDIVFGKGNEGPDARRLSPADRRDVEAHGHHSPVRRRFFVGNKNAGYIINDAKALGARGYTSVSANYRLQQESLWPAQIHDTKAAIRWTRANADRLGVEPNRIVIAGYSAGGMLSLMAAGTNGRKEFEGEGGNAGVSSDVNASIGVYPLASAQIATGLFAQGQATPENIAAASPTSHISKTFAPTIFIHGTNDGTVPVQSSIDFFSKLHALGVPSTLTLIQGADHAFDNGVGCRRTDGPVDRPVSGPAHGQPEVAPVVGAGGGGRGRGRGGPGGQR